MITQQTRFLSTKIVDKLKTNYEIIDWVTKKTIVPMIGLEVHAQLKLNSKLFSQGGNCSLARSNTQLDLFDIALPGTLPKLNRKGINAAILSSIGLNCQVQDVVHFDRKNYFYTDMPAGFQITQYNNPIAKNGYLDFIVTTYHGSTIAHFQQYDIAKHLFSEERKQLEEFEPYIKRSHIKQIQVEQDSAKSLHDNKELCSLVDYNRSGAGLIEIVFEPDLTNHHEAASLVKELIAILKALNTCDCELQEGSLRVDANVSIKSISGDVIENSSRVELKNLNSLRSLNKSIHHEILRQSRLIESGDKVIQETRTYDTKADKTIPLRVKEEAVDYRYVPEPSIPPLKLDRELVKDIQNKFPDKMPHVLRDILIKDYAIDLDVIAEVMDEPGLSFYLIRILKDETCRKNANLVADFLIYSIANLRTVKDEIDLCEGGDFSLSLSEEKMIDLLNMTFEEEINFAKAYEVIKYIYIEDNNAYPRDVVDQFNWYSINDMETINEMCTDLISKMKSISKKYRKKGGKIQLRLMLEKLSELTENKINIKRANEVIDDQLKPPRN